MIALCLWQVLGVGLFLVAVYAVVYSIVEVVFVFASLPFLRKRRKPVTTRWDLQREELSRRAKQRNEVVRAFEEELERRLKS